jgi:cell division topological specificity factor
MEHIKNDIAKVISKYMKIDTTNMDVQISKTSPALYANIPILDLYKK